MSEEGRQNYARWFTEYPKTHQRAGATVEVAVASWDGLLAILEAYYPEEVFRARSGDPGSHIVALCRANERLATFIESRIPGSSVNRATGLVVT